MYNCLQKIKENRSFFWKKSYLVTYKFSSNVLKLWKEYFDELLNVKYDNGIVEIGNDRSLDAPGIVVDEIENAKKMLKWGKAAGVDEIQHEYLICSGSASRVNF